ncbi:hypothetical protein PN498_00835 [Oscillatoria sp. CS-180]|uniref:hypothetical protein n=1 Tax=Oscillatoria sp. CS-180 TaxID=3021720 RepID=UPI00232C7CE2|nr:hypothetical protein [Oscillatoria sp. CS-180]MDB9524518.1 hypothetical protein [Oscillatoria sp. CS-180]
MQIPDNPSNSDIRDALVQLREGIDIVRHELSAEISSVREDLGKDIKALSEKVDRQDYKFDAFQRGTDNRVRMAITIIIATATVVVLPSLSPAIVALMEAFAQ